MSPSLRGWAGLGSDGLGWLAALLTRISVSKLGEALTWMIRLLIGGYESNAAAEQSSGQVIESREEERRRKCACTRTA